MWRIIALMLASGLVGPPSLAQDASRSDVLAAVDGFLAAMRAKDSLGMMARLDSTSRFTLLRTGPDGTVVRTLSGREFVRLTTKPDGPSYHEPTRNAIVQIDGDLAALWAEYQVIVDGKLSHCGHDAIHLARIGGQWKIINLSDTYRREGCEPMWPAK
jgi:hypothetical protein